MVDRFLGYVLIVCGALGFLKGMYEMHVSRPLQRQNDPWMGHWNNGYRSFRELIFDFFLKK